MNNRNLILKTFLTITKKNEPYCFSSPEEFYSKYEPLFKNFLEDRNCEAIIDFEEIGFLSYKCPFNSDNTNRMKSWILIRHPNQIVSFLVFRQFERQGNGRRVIEKAWNLLGCPDKVDLIFPNKKCFICLKKVLRDKAEVKVINKS